MELILKEYQHCGLNSARWGECAGLWAGWQRVGSSTTLQLGSGAAEWWCAKGNSKESVQVRRMPSHIPGLEHINELAHHVYLFTIPRW